MYNGRVVTLIVPRECLFRQEDRYDTHYLIHFEYDWYIAWIRVPLVGRRTRSWEIRLREVNIRPEFLIGGLIYLV